MEDRELEEMGAAEALDVGGVTFVTEGVKGSLVMSGKEASCPESSWVRNSIDLTKTTWQFSGFKNRRQHQSLTSSWETFLTSIPSKGLPFHALLHSLAFLPFRNFMSTMYLFPLSVLIIRK